MRGYLALSWSATDAEAANLAAEIRRRAEVAGHTTANDGPTHWLGVVGPNPPKAYSPRRGVLIVGEVHTHPAGAGGAPDTSSEQAFAAWHSRHRWGRYVILFRDDQGHVAAVFRDPSGALPVVTWRTAGVQIVGSETPDWLVSAAPPGITFDWDRVRDLLHNPFDLAGTSPLEGLTTVAPGVFHEPGGPMIRLWSAEAEATGEALSPKAATEELRHRLDACVTALGRSSAFGMELSGGLDSAIVAGAVKATGRRLAFALNTRAPQLETDERRFARQVAEGLDIPLSEQVRREVPFTAEAFEATAGDPLPSQNGRDLSNDLTVAEACREAGVEMLLTGKGGDALFFQMHTPLAFADLLRRRPVSALFSSHLPGVARWTRTSTWSVLNASRPHPDEPALPPAKQMQISAIASGLAYYSGCRRSEVVDMVHPLMAQPLVEWALRTPVPTLVPDGHERGLARSAFADRLPAAIATRRGKGDYGAYFNQQAARNLDFLRPYLLDGRLASEGVLDRSLMEARLDEDALRWRGGAPEILAAVSLEAWVRRWEGRRAGV